MYLAVISTYINVIFVVAQRAVFGVICEYIWATLLRVMIANHQSQTRQLHHHLMYVVPLSVHWCQHIHCDSIKRWQYMCDHNSVGSKLLFHTYGLHARVYTPYSLHGSSTISSVAEPQSGQ